MAPSKLSPTNEELLQKVVDSCVQCDEACLCNLMLDGSAATGTSKHIPPCCADSPPEATGRGGRQVYAYDTLYPPRNNNLEFTLQRNGLDAPYVGRGQCAVYTYAHRVKLEQPSASRVSHCKVLCERATWMDIIIKTIIILLRV